MWGWGMIGKQVPEYLEQYRVGQSIQVMCKGDDSLWWPLRYIGIIRTIFFKD